MASPTDDPLPINWEKILIGASFDSTGLYVFLMGAYTVVFLATIYLYLTRKNETNKVIVSTITALYIVSFGQLCLQWYDLEPPFIDYSTTRVSLLYALYEDSASAFRDISSTVLEYIGYLLADSLLVWRCIMLHGHWSRILIIPLLLFTVEIAMTIAATIFSVLEYIGSEYEMEQRSRQFEVLDGALSITVTITSLIVTLLICYRIHIRTKDVLRISHRRRYKSTIRILIDSSMIYTLAVVCNSIISFLHPKKLETFSGVIFNVVPQFTNMLVVLLSALAPTIMVAQITAYNDKESDEMSSIRLPSNLQVVPTQSITTFPKSDDNLIELRHRAPIGGDNV